MRSVKKRRTNLWNRDPHCYYCGCLTILPDDVEGYKDKGHIKVTPNNMATIEHLISRLHPLRGKTKGITTLACYKCNNEVNHEDMTNLGADFWREFSKLDKIGRIDMLKKHKLTKSEINQERDE